MAEILRPEQATVAPTYSLRRIDGVVMGVNYLSYELHNGLLLDDRLAMRFVAAPRTIKIGFFQFKNCELIPEESVEDFAYSRGYELIYPDGWKIQIRGFMGKGGLFISLGGIEGKFVRPVEADGVILPPPWQYH